MQTRSKVVEASGRKFQVRRLPPDTGSFIFMRMLGVSMRMTASAAEEKKQPIQSESSEEAKKTSESVDGEAQVRALAFVVFSGGISFEDFKFIQNNCMKVVSVVEEREGVIFPLPIMNDAGIWTAEGASVENDVGLVMKLTTEVLILCFADFFAGSSPGL